MKYNYSEKTLKSTEDLVAAVSAGDEDGAKKAIANGADVNCRLIFGNDGLCIATPEELSRTKSNTHRPSDDVVSVQDKETKVTYEVPMVGTTTLLNLLARREMPKVADATKNLSLSRLLMENGAELGAIDYQSYWSDWGDRAENYFQNTPLLNAIASYNLEFAQLYMEHLQHLDLDKRQEILNYKDKFRAGFHTALEFAIRRGYSGLATSIVHAGADTNPQPFVYCYGGKSPLHMACMLLGNSYTDKGWHKRLGSDLELITTLLEYGADYTKKAKTEVYTGQPFINGAGYTWEKQDLFPFHYLDGAIGTGGESTLDFIGACDSPAFSPEKKGQVKHPFHEENCFLDQIASALRTFKCREKYLKSPRFLQKDRVILQKALLKRIVLDYQNTFLDGKPLKGVDLNNIDIDNTLTVLTKINTNWMDIRMSSYFCFRGSKPDTEETAIPDEKNPLFNLALQNKISHCSSNYYEGASPGAVIRQTRPQVIVEPVQPLPRQAIPISRVAVNEGQQNFSSATATDVKAVLSYAQQLYAHWFKGSWSGNDHAEEKKFGLIKHGGTGQRRAKRLIDNIKNYSELGDIFEEFGRYLKNDVSYDAGFFGRHKTQHHPHSFSTFFMRLVSESDDVFNSLYFGNFEIRQLSFKVKNLFLEAGLTLPKKLEARTPAAEKAREKAFADLVALTERLSTPQSRL